MDETMELDAVSGQNPASLGFATVDEPSTKMLSTRISTTDSTPAVEDRSVSVQESPRPPGQLTATTGALVAFGGDTGNRTVRNGRLKMFGDEPRELVARTRST